MKPSVASGSHLLLRMQPFTNNHGRLLGGFCVYDVSENRVLYETLGSDARHHHVKLLSSTSCHCDYDPPSPPPSAPSPPSPPPSSPPPSEPPSPPPCRALRSAQSNERLGVAWTEWDAGRRLSEAQNEPLDISNCRGGIENIWEVRVTLTTDDQGERDVFAEYMSNDDSVRTVDDEGTGTSYESCGLPVLVGTERLRQWSKRRTLRLVLLIVFASLACCLPLLPGVHRVDLAGATGRM